MPLNVDFYEVFFAAVDCSRSFHNRNKVTSMVMLLSQKKSEEITRLNRGTEILETQGNILREACGSHNGLSLEMPTPAQFPSRL